MSTRPTLQELRDFARLPWVRCTTCGRVTGNKQEQFDAILADKANTYYDAAQESYDYFIQQGFDDFTAGRLADKQAQIKANVTFNRRVTDELGLKEYCCFKTLQNPIVLPLGSGIDIDPDVDIGTRMSQLQIQPNPEGEQEPAVRRIYKAN